MFSLVSTTDTLQVVSTTTATTDVLVTYADNSSGTITPGTQASNVTTATTTTVCAAPGASVQRAVTSVSIRNKSASTAQNVTVQVVKGGTTTVEIISAALLVGQSLTYEDGFGWAVSSNSAAAGLEFLGSTVLTGNATTTNTVTIPARDILTIEVRVTGYSAGDIASLRFNGDAGANYWSRYISAVAGGVVLVNNQNVSQALARLFALAVTTQRTGIVNITNLATTSKVGVVNGQTSTGAAATAGTIEFGGFEWVNTANQITSIAMLTAGGATMPAGTGFAVWGKNL